MNKKLLEADKIFLRKLSPFLGEVIAATPKNARVYLVGGTLRNLFAYPQNPKLKLKQRDYDLVVFGNTSQFLRNLIKKGFLKGSIQREHQTTLKKPIFKGAKSLDDFLVLDIAGSGQLDMTSSGKINDFIAKKINFTVNGLGIDIADLRKENWREHIVSPFMDQALKDLQNSRVRLNPKKKQFFSSDIFACARFVAAGFSPPSRKEVAVLKEAFLKNPPENIEKQKWKLISYTNDKSVNKALIRLGVKNLLK